MPLVKSSSKAARNENIRRLLSEGKRPQKQSIAIAYSIQREMAKKRGK